MTLRAVVGGVESGVEWSVKREHEQLARREANADNNCVSYHAATKTQSIKLFFRLRIHHECDFYDAVAFPALPFPFHSLSFHRRCSIQSVELTASFPLESSAWLHTTG
jgi:hypothetical protein